MTGVCGQTSMFFSNVVVVVAEKVGRKVIVVCGEATSFI
jgi:hypothetical protein